MDSSCRESGFWRPSHGGVRLLVAAATLEGTSSGRWRAVADVGCFSSPTIGNHAAVSSRGRSMRPPPRTNLLEPPSNRATLASNVAAFSGLTTPDSLAFRAALGVACGLAWKAVVSRRGLDNWDRSRDRNGGGGYGSEGYGAPRNADEQQSMREAKRTREATQFFTYQRRLIRTGTPPRDDEYWRREEMMLFDKRTMSNIGINFDDYDEITVERRGGQGMEEPMETFIECCERYDIPEELKANILKCGYDKPTPVQKHSMPAALQKTDVMVAAQTGSGKTAAFLVPCIAKSMLVGATKLEEGPSTPTSVILAPTRELCQQITFEAKKMCWRTPLRVVSIYGGADAMPQIKELAESPELIVCTPGRLEDFLGRGIISMEKVQSLVLDEADRMLDMGFEPQIRSIIEAHGMPQTGLLDGNRQTMMFSATFPAEIQDMALDFLDPTYLWVGVGRVGTAVKSVQQKFTDVATIDDDGKFMILVDALEAVQDDDGAPAKTIIFCNSKHVVDDVSWRLSDNRIRAAQIHGGLTQAARDRAIMDLKRGTVSVLVATDVAARGLDLPGIDHVINYELPRNSEDYVHRIGRTGRIGNEGISTSFVSGFEPALRDIVQGISAQIENDGEGRTSPVPRWLEAQVERAKNAKPMNRYGGRGERGPPRGGGYGGRGNSPEWARDLPAKSSRSSRPADRGRPGR